METCERLAKMRLIVIGDGDPAHIRNVDALIELAKEAGAEELGARMAGNINDMLDRFERAAD